MVMEKPWITYNRSSKAYDEGVKAFLEFAKTNNPKSGVIPCPCIKCINLFHHLTNNVRYHLFAHGFDEDTASDHDEETVSDHNEETASNHDEETASDNDEETKSQSGPTIKPKASKGKTVVGYTKRGVPVGKQATKLASFEGKIARTMVPITIKSWLEVPKEIKEDLWQYVSKKFELDLKSKKKSLQSIGTKWRTFKHNLYTRFIKPNIKHPEELFNPPEMYPQLEKEEWKIFVAQRLSKKWQEKSDNAKSVRAQNIYNHRLSRKGYAGLLVDIMEETGKEEEEIDRATLWKEGRKSKKGEFDKNVQAVVDKIDVLQKSECFEPFGSHDVLTEALGTEEQRGHVRGMGKYVMPQQYFFLPKNVKKYIESSKMQADERFSKLEKEMEKLKRGMNNVSGSTSFQMGADVEAFEEEVSKESLDNSCYLAVDVVSNIVAKGSIMKHSASDENIEVMLETCVNGEALLPFPLKVEFIVRVKEAVGHILSWPRHLVIRCSDLGKAVAKPIRNNAKRLREFDEENEKEDGNEKKQPRKQEKEIGKKNAKKDGEEIKNKKEIGNENAKKDGEGMENKKEKETMQRRCTRAQRKTRIRIEKSAILKMTALMVDGQVSKVNSIKVQCDDDLFGYESFTYLTLDDFEAVFTLEELTGAVITSYMMYLFEQIKNGSKSDHGVCFVSPSASSPVGRKTKSKNIDDSSQSIANRLSKRKENDIILIPYNPGRHWVLAALHMKTATCYYLDSLRASRSVNPQLRQTIDAAMALYATQSGSKKVKLNWINAKCPRQPGTTECGYYMLKFMKEIVDEGVELLVNDNVGGGKVEYTDADIDEIREGWSTFVANFIFR